jgi:predicted transcriptional regulator
MQISNSEKILMDVLWQSSSSKTPLSAKQIIQQVDQSLDWHDKTVKTLLNRLLKKEAIGFIKKGREYLYYSILKEQDYVQQVSNNFLQRVFNGSVTSLVASFAKQEKLSEKDLAELKALINDIEK